MKKLLPALLSVSILAAVPAGAGAAPHLVGNAQLSGPPGQMTTDADGNAWALFDGAGNETLARVRPNGKVKEYAIPALNAAVDIARGPNGNLWATLSGAVVRVPAGDPLNAQDFDINGLDGGGQGIAYGPKNSLWATGGDQLVHFKPGDPAGFEAQTINGMSSRGLATDGGNVWIADFGGQSIVRVKASDGAVKRFGVGGNPQQVTDGNGGQIAYSNPGDIPQTVGRIGPSGGPRETNDPGSDPFGIEHAGDGNYWIGQFNKPGKVGILEPDGDLRQFSGIQDSGRTRYLAAGQGGTLFAGVENKNDVAIIKGL